MDNLEHLPDDRREALIMRFALGMDNREIARALGRTDGATKVLIHRAIKQLQEEMDDEWASERAAGSWDVERLLADALRPIEPPERLSRPARGHALGAITQAAAEELSDWAEELSESELRAAARPAQLGAAGGRRRRRRRRDRRPGAARDAPPRPPAGQGRPALPGRPGQAVAADAWPRSTSSRSTGGREPGADAEQRRGSGGGSCPRC